MFDEVPAVYERDGGDVACEALLVVDASSGRLTYVNAAAMDLFAVSEPAAGDIRAVDLLPQLANLAPRNFEARLTSDGRDRRVAVRLEAMRGGSAVERVALLAAIRELDGGGRPQPDGAPGAQVQARRLRRIESLLALLVQPDLRGPEQARALLRAGALAVGLERAALARQEGDELVVEFTDPQEDAGARVPLERSLSRAALTRSGTFAVLDTRADPEFRRVASDARCFLASAFRVGRVRYVLTFSSTAARTRPFDDEDWGYVASLIDALARCIERGERDAHIERLAYSDALTALPNRIAVLGRLDEAIAEAERNETRVAVLFLDIDGFKNVNDTVGHGGGDIVLAEVAQRLRGTLRKEEYIGRLGGDEFAIVMPHLADREEVESIAQRIGGVLTFPFAVDDCRFSLSASIGVAVYPDDATGREELLACADTAMYAAKDGGSSRVRIREAAQAPGDVSGGALAALGGEARDAEFMLCYQPILDLRSGRVVSAEALLRRNHPLHGLLPPERGWSIARDEAGRRALDRWVLREALAQARAWDANGTPIRVDVNIAAFDAREIDGLLADTLPAQDVRQLRVELAPGRLAVADGAEHVAEFVAHCAKSGIALALDGFDGSLAALASLANLPIDAVKLERPLVESVPTSRTARAVVEGTIVVARSLGWRIIGKGVETAAECDALASLGCDEVQGFYVAHPMTATDFGNWLGRRAFVGREA
jgi:diguanylate cyclase (GGDEF)-like protein